MEDGNFCHGAMPPTYFVNCTVALLDLKNLITCVCDKGEGCCFEWHEVIAEGVQMMSSSACMITSFTISS
jgi:hypothetical protein